MEFKRTSEKLRMEQEWKLRENWHKWFAWYPVKVAEKNGEDTYVWLQYVERRLHFWMESGMAGGGSGWAGEYRKLVKEGR